MLQIVSSVDGSELSIDTSTWSANDQQNFDPAQYYGSTDMSTTSTMTTPSIENGPACNQILLTVENSTTPISVQRCDLPAIFETSKRFGYDNSKFARGCCENPISIDLTLCIFTASSVLELHGIVVG